MLEGVRFGGHKIPSLLFVDDVVLFALGQLNVKHVAMVLIGKKVECLLWVLEELLPHMKKFKYLKSCSQVRGEWREKWTGGLRRHWQ